MYVNWGWQSVVTLLIWAEKCVFNVTMGYKITRIHALLYMFLISFSVLVGCYTISLRVLFILGYTETTGWVGEFL